MKPDKNICIIGIGNEFRSDDGAGIAAVRIMEQNYNHLENPKTEMFFYYFSEDVSSMISLFEKYRRFIIIDAVSSGQPPGTLHKLDLIHLPADTGGMKFSGHLMNIMQAVQLGILLHPECLQADFYGIEGNNFNYGFELHEAVRQSLEKTASDLEKKYFSFT